MRRAVVLVFWMAVLAVPLPSALAADLPEGALGQGPIHQSVSMITRIDRAAGLMVIKLDGGRLVRLTVDGATTGEPLAAMVPGDFIRENSVRMDADTARALQIRLVRTASEELGSFEK